MEWGMGEGEEERRSGYRSCISSGRVFPLRCLDCVLRGRRGRRWEGVSAGGGGVVTCSVW